MSFNKMVESQLAKTVDAIPISNDGKIPAQPKNSCEKVNAVVTRGGKSTRDPPNPNHSVGKAKQHQEAEPSTTQEEKKRTRSGDGTKRLHRHQLPTVSHKKLQAGRGRAIRSFC